MSSISLPRTCATFFAAGFAAPAPESTSVNVNARPGEALALRLSAALREAGHPAEAPYCEDWGWCVEFRVADEAHWLGVGRRTTAADLLGDEAAAHPAAESGPDWLCFIERRRSLRTLFARASERQVTTDAAAAVHAALSAQPEVTELSWHHKARFDAGDEAHGASTPT